MEGCSINDAFPSGPYGSASCLDTKVADESRRQEKKRARKCRGPHGTYLNMGYNMVGAIDSPPDKPYKMDLDSLPTLNPATGMTVHKPVTEQYNYETFVGGMDDLPAIRQDVAGPNALQGSTAPSFFGVGPNDERPAAHAKRNGLVENFQSQVAPFTNVIGTEESYTLEPDFRKSFATSGTAKAENVPMGSGPSPTSLEMSYLTPTKMLPNSILPVPNIDLFWKSGNGAVAGGQSSFFSHLKSPGGEPAGSAVDQDAASDVPGGRREVLEKLDRIFARLDDADATRSENSQTEVLLFIMTGLGVIFLMDIGCRAAVGLRR